MTARPFSDAQAIATWAQEAGYKRRGGLWRKPDHYLTFTRDCNGGPLFAEMCAYGTGKIMGRVA